MLLLCCYYSFIKLCLFAHFSGPGKSPSREASGGVPSQGLDFGCFLMIFYVLLYFCCYLYITIIVLLLQLCYCNYVIMLYLLLCYVCCYKTQFYRKIGLGGDFSPRGQKHAKMRVKKDRNHMGAEFRVPKKGGVSELFCKIDPGAIFHDFL